MHDHKWFESLSVRHLTCNKSLKYSYLVFLYVVLYANPYAFFNQIAFRGVNLTVCINIKAMAENQLNYRSQRNTIGS